MGSGGGGNRLLLPLEDVVSNHVVERNSGNYLLQ